MRKLVEIYFLLFRFWVKLDQKIRFILVGGWNFVVSYLLFVLFLFGFGENNEQLALLCSFLLSSVQSYFSQKIYVFLTRGNYFQEYLKCFCTWLIGYFENALLLALFVHVLGLDAYKSQFFVQVIVAVTSYLLLKHFAFKHKLINKN